MQLLEVKNNIAKISYNPEENKLLPSDFLLIEDLNLKLVGQILSVYTTEQSKNTNIADVRLALYIDKEDKISYYNGYIPSRTAKVIYITADEITEMINNSSESIYLGNLTYHPKSMVKTSISLIDEGLYIQCDREDNAKVIVQNIVSALYMQHKKAILLDFDGRYSRITNVARLTVTESFNFPLNIDAFNNILEYDTLDCPLEDKAVIQSIVLELRDYVNTLENKFLPFTLFKNVIISEFAANPISGLMLLRNKLWEYAQNGLFAENKSDFDIINNVLKNENVLILDASKIDEKWYKYTIQTIPKILESNCYFAFSLNDVNMDKRSISSLYNNSKITPIVTTSYESQIRNTLKSLCKNQILFKPSKQTDVDEQYKSLIHKLNDNDFILFGEASLNLPLIIELKPYDMQISEKLSELEIRRNVDKILSSGKSMLPKEAVISDKKEDIETEEDIINEEISDEDLDFLDNINSGNITDRNIAIAPQEDGNYNLFSPSEDIEYEEEPKVNTQEQDIIDFNSDNLEIQETLNADEQGDTDNINEEEFKIIDNDEDIFIDKEDIETPDSKDYDEIIFPDNEEENTVDETDSIIEYHDEKLEQDFSSSELINIKDNTEENELEIIEDHILEDLFELDDFESKQEVIRPRKREVYEDDHQNFKLPEVEPYLKSDILYINDVEDEKTTDNIQYIEEKNSNETELVENTIDINEIPIEKDKTQEIIFEQKTNEETIEISDNSENNVSDEDLQFLDNIQNEESVEQIQKTSKTQSNEEIQENDNSNENEHDALIDDLFEDDETENIKNEINTQYSPEEDNTAIYENIEDEFDEILLEEEPQEIKQTPIKKQIKQEEEIVPIANVIENIKQQVKKPAPTPKQEEQPIKQLNTRVSTSIQTNNKTKNYQTQNKNLTVYEPDIDIDKDEEQTSLELQKGDRVYHPKYGNGVVEEFLPKFGNIVSFCLIKFENVGRRMLDPRVSDIVKIK